MDDQRKISQRYEHVRRSTEAFMQRRLGESVAETSFLRTSLKPPL